MDREQERSIVAMAMVLLAEEHDVTFRKDDVALEAPMAMMSAQLVSDLMRLSAFSANITEDLTGRPGGPRTYLPGEDILMAMAFDYAIEIAPRMKGGDLTQSVDLRDLAEMIRGIEAAGGRIDIDHDMVSRVTSSAIQRIASAPASPSDSMERHA